MRTDRFKSQSVTSHKEYSVAMVEMREWLTKFTPRVAILEQVEGFDLPVEKGDSKDNTPMRRRDRRT